jgi:hypothetical protein
MATIKQIESARRNGALSRGPVTPEGRAVSSRNSLKHALTSKKIFVLANESSGVFEDLAETIRTEHQPLTGLENEICIAIAHAHWRLRRLWITECAMYDRQMDARAQTPQVDEGARIAEAFEHIAADNHALGLLTRYENRLYRTIDRLEERLRRLRRAREATKLAGENIFCENEPDASPASVGCTCRSSGCDEPGCAPTAPHDRKVS